MMILAIFFGALQGWGVGTIVSLWGDKIATRTSKNYGFVFKIAMLVLYTLTLWRR